MLWRVVRGIQLKKAAIPATFISAIPTDRQISGPFGLVPRIMMLSLKSSPVRRSHRISQPCLTSHRTRQKHAYGTNVLDPLECAYHAMKLCVQDDTAR